MMSLPKYVDPTSMSRAEPELLHQSPKVAKTPEKSTPTESKSARSAPAPDHLGSQPGVTGSETPNY